MGTVGILRRACTHAAGRLAGSKGSVSARGVVRLGAVASLAAVAVLAVASIASSAAPIALPASVSLNGWDTVSDSWTPGNTVQYSEGDVIPFRLDLSGLSTTETYRVNICREFQNGTHYGFLFLDEFDTTVPLTNAEAGGTVVDQPDAFAGVNTTVTNVNTVNGTGGICGPQERLVQVDVTVSSATTAYLLWGGHLASPIDQVPGAPAGTIVGFGNGAGSYPGSSLAMRLVSPDKTVPVPINKIIILSKIDVQKVVVGGSAIPSNWSFTISGANLPSGYTPITLQATAPGDSVSFLSLPSGTYTITESNIAGYSLTSVIGANCVVKVLADGTGEATVTAQTGAPITASCVFTNTFSKQTPTVATDIHAGSGASDVAGAAAITHAAIGSTVHDKATVSGVTGFGTPTGDVTFTVYAGNTTCTGTGTSAGTVALAGTVAHPSSDSTVPVGGLSYKAHYNGDTIYNGVDGPCEPLAGDKLTSTTSTDVHNAAHGIITSAAIGSTVHDKASVSGSTAGGTPQGTVTFTVYTGNTTCTGTGAAAGTVTLNGSGVADPSDSATVPVGGLSYKAHYNGSPTYEESTGDCESLSAAKLDSTTATLVHDAGHSVITSAPIGTTVHDQASVTGTTAGGTPAGTVTFTVYTGNTACEGEGSAAGTVTLDGSGVADPSDSATVPVGGLSYQAHYNGSPTYNESTGDCEPLAAGKLSSTTATDVHNAGHEVVTHAPIGSTVHDRASVTGTTAGGTPTGSVTFTVYMGNTDCEGEGTSAGTVTLDGSGIAHPSSTAVVPVGGLSYKAHYNGSDTYEGSTGPCEALAGDKVASTTATDIHNGSHGIVTSVAAGTTVHDKATVSGALGTPTGTVTFKWFTNNTCAGTAAATSDTFTLSGGSVDATTFAFTTPSGASGSFSFQATYSGNGTYNGSTGACEPLSSTFTPPPPPPPPPPPAPPLIDLAVTKVDTPDPAKLNGQITYTMVVTNNGPDTATQVTAADPLPAGTSFVSVSSTQGTCANNGGLIQCSIGTLAKGASATVTLVVTATQVGTVTNEVTVVGHEAESNTANNRASATTLVPAPLVPPKPKPKPLPVVCYTFTISTKSVTVGKTKRIAVRVTLRGKAVAGAKVRVTGAGINKTVRTGKNGRVLISIRAKKAGILKITVLQKAVCGSKRIGVVGAFEPPVTG